MFTTTFAASSEALLVLAVMLGLPAFAVLLGWRLGFFPAATVGSGAICFVIFWAAQPSFAQTAEEIVRRAEERARAVSDHAQSLFEGVNGREALYQADAQQLLDGNALRLKKGFSYLDEDQFEGAKTLAGGLERAQDPGDGVVYVAVSFSMPPEDLRRIGREAHKAGATVVIRGLVRGSFKETLAAAKRVFDENSIGGVAIDPNVFRAFNIQQVPVFISAKGPVEPCGNGLNCVSVAPAHDRLSGNITLNEALRLLAERGDQAPSAAAAARQRLEG